MPRVGPKAGDGGVAGRGRHAPVVLDRPEAREPLSQPTERLGPLAEDEGLPAARLHLLELRLEPSELRALPRRGVEVADLLEPEDELEDVADRRLAAERGEPQHALLLGQPVGLPLLGAEFDPFVAVEPRRHVVEHLVLRASQNMIGHRPGQFPRGHAVGEVAGGDEVEDAVEVVGGVLDGCAGEGPRPAARDGTDRLVRLARAILDPLRLVEDDEVELEAEVGHEVTVAHEHLVVGELHGHVRKGPLPATAFRVPLDHRHDELGRPVGQLAHPVGNEPLRTGDEHAAGLAPAHEQPDRRNRLHRLPEPHLVGEHRTMPGHEERHAIELERERTPRKFESACLQHRLEVGLQQVEVPLRQLDDIARRSEPRATGHGRTVVWGNGGTRDRGGLPAPSRVDGRRRRCRHGEAKPAHLRTCGRKRQREHLHRG